MNREDIIRIGLEAGMRLYCDSWTVEDDPDSKNPKQISTSHLKRFAALVVFWDKIKLFQNSGKLVFSHVADFCYVKIFEQWLQMRPFV